MKTDMLNLIILKFKSMYIFSVFIIIVIVIVFFVFKLEQKNKPYYNIYEIEPKLKNIDKDKNKILKEILEVKYDNENWMDWPEKELYNKENNWKIYPLNVFGKWINNNCIKCPVLTRFLKSIPNLKMALLSKMSGGTILTPHQGWWKLSNYSIRCHYGLIVPPKCFVEVLHDNIWHKKYHKQFEWLIFDDSKMHNAQNLSNEDRMVLLLDVKRPNNIQIGKSEIEDTKELKEIVSSLTELKNSNE